MCCPINPLYHTGPAHCSQFCILLHPSSVSLPSLSAYKHASNSYKGFCFLSDPSSPLSSLLTSICCTVRSRKVRSERTGMMDLGPLHPIEVPSPPFSFTTTSLFRRARISPDPASTSSSYPRTCERKNGIPLPHTPTSLLPIIFASLHYPFLTFSLPHSLTPSLSLTPLHSLSFPPFHNIFPSYPHTLTHTTTLTVPSSRRLILSQLMGAPDDS